MISVSVNATSAKVGGGLSYLGRQLEALERQSNIALWVHTSTWNHDYFTNTLSSSELSRVNVKSVAARALWEQTVWPQRSRGHDVMYAPGNFGPLFTGSIPSVVALQNPNYVGRHRHEGSNRTIPRILKIGFSRLTLRRADGIVAISHAISTDLLSDFPDFKARVSTIQSGAPLDMVPDASRPPFEAGTYYVSLANDYPHKQISLLVRAWTKLDKAVRPPLILIGELSERKSKEFQAMARQNGCAELLAVLGVVSDRARVAKLLKDARGMIAPSLREAFPLTPSEAGSLGTPLLLSDIPAHREVAGENAIYFPPDLAGLLEAWRGHLKSPATRIPWKWEYSWEQHAKDLAAFLTTVVEQQ